MKFWFLQAGNSTGIKVAHYELIKRNPFTEYNPGIKDYQLYEIYPVKKLDRK